MKWLEIDGNGLLTGEDAFPVFDAFFAVFRIALGQVGGSHRTVLEHIVSGAVDDEVEDKFKAVVKRVSQTLIDLDVGTRVGTMRTPVGAIAATGAGDPVNVLWPHKDWVFGPVESARLPVGMSLNAEGGVKYALAPNDGRPTPAGSVLATLSLSGELGFNANLAVPAATIAGITAGAEVDVERRIEYLLAYDKDLRTWKAVADGFSRIRRIDSFKSVLKGFRTPPPIATDDADSAASQALEEIRIIGGEQLKLRAGTTLRVPLAKAGTLRGRAGGELRLGDGYTIRITERQTGAGAGARPPALILEASADKSFDTDGEVGIGYAFGVSDLAPDAAKSLLNAVVSAEEVIDQIDDFLEGDHSLLKPGEMLNGFIRDQVKSRISGSGIKAKSLRIALGDMIGLDAEGDIDALAGRAGDLLSTLLDNSSNLFGPDLTAIVRAVFLPPSISNRVQDRVREELKDVSDAVGGKLGDILELATDQIDSEIHEMIAELLDRDTSRIDRAERRTDLQTFLNTARETLSKITTGIQDSNLDLIAGEVAFSMGRGTNSVSSFSAEIEEEGAEFYRNVIWRPGTGAARLIDTVIDPDKPPLPGVTPLTAADSETVRNLRGRSWNVGLIDTPVTRKMLGLGGARKTFAQAKVERTLSGVTVGTESWNRVRRETDFLWKEGAARFVELADTLSFVSASDADGAPDVATGRLSLSYTWEEPEFGPDEMRRFTRRFEQCRLLGREGAEALIKLREEAKSPGVSKPEASLRALLIVPPDHAVSVIKFVANSRTVARDIIQTVVAADPFERKEFKEKHVNALLDYFLTLHQSQDRMMKLSDSADEAARTALRDQLAKESRRAQVELRDKKWLKLRSLFGIALGKPHTRLMALFACIAELSAAAPGVTRPGMVFGFTPVGKPTKFVISPNAGRVAISASRRALLQMEDDADDA